MGSLWKIAAFDPPTHVLTVEIGGVISLSGFRGHCGHNFRPSALGSKRQLA